MVVYRFTNLIDGKVYIGKWQGTRVEIRWKDHFSSALADGNQCPYFYRAIRKYGAAAFRTDVLYTAKTPSELNAMETFFIVLHQSHVKENGYNLTLGGKGLINPSEETREKLRAARGRNNPWPKGSKHSAESLQVMKEFHLKNPLPLDVLAAGGKLHKGLVRSPETCERIKLSKQGFKPVRSGNMVIWTPERRAIQAARMLAQRLVGNDPSRMKGANHATSV